MIATWKSDYWCWTVVEELLVAGLGRGDPLDAAAVRVQVVEEKKLDTRCSARESKGVSRR